MPGVQQNRQQVRGNVSVESRDLLVEEVADRIARGKTGRICEGEDIDEPALARLAQLRLLASDFRIVHAGGRVAEHECTYAIGISSGEAERRPSAHRLAGERGTLDAKVVE